MKLSLRCTGISLEQLAKVVGSYAFIFRLQFTGGGGVWQSETVPTSESVLCPSHCISCTHRIHSR